jgi:hypothetical protein
VTYIDPCSIHHLYEEITVSIVRVGLGEDDKFADGYEAIFGKKPDRASSTKKPAATKPAAKKATPAKKPAAKKATAKKK